MSENQDSDDNLVKWIEDSFSEVDNGIITALPETNEEYAALRQEIRRLNQDYPLVGKALEGEGAISLSAEEHAALVQHRSLTMEMEDIERLQLYFRGHTDCFAYLKKIGAI